MDTQTASKKGETIYQFNADALSTVSTYIYTYLHRLQAGLWVVYTASAGRAEATQSLGEQ